MSALKLTKTLEKALRDQSINLDQPGSILRDFSMLLDFVGRDGVEVGGKYNLLPLKQIGELDLRLTRPLHLEMKRPQLRSHPYLQGLNLLLRASRLTRVVGSGTKSRLIVAPEMHEQWIQLNPTEQYFNLMEAWLRLGRAEMIGERASALSDLLFPCLETWRFLGEEKRTRAASKPQEVYFLGIGRDFYQLALMDLFGLVNVEMPTPPVTSWAPVRVKQNSFGDAVFTILYQERFGFLTGHETPDDEEEEPEEAQFGAWQTAY